MSHGTVEWRPQAPAPSRFVRIGQESVGEAHNRLGAFGVTDRAQFQ